MKQSECSEAYGALALEIAGGACPNAARALKIVAEASKLQPEPALVRQSARNGCSGLPWCHQSARNGWSGPLALIVHGYAQDNNSR